MPILSNMTLRTKNRILGVLLVSLALLTALSLASFNPQDLGRERGESPGNWGGIVGALFSSWSFKFFGIPLAALIPVFLFLWGVNRVRSASPGGLAFKNGITVAGFLIVSSIAGISQRLKSVSGDLGASLGGSLASLFGTAGAYVVLAGLLFVVLLAVSESALGKAYGLLGWLLRVPAARISLAIREFLEKRREKNRKPKVVKRDAVAADGLTSGESGKLRAARQEKTPPRIVSHKVDVPPKAEPGPVRVEIEKAATPAESREQKEFQLPPVSLLDEIPASQGSISEGELIESSKILEGKLSDFGVNGKVTEVHPGPVITTFEFEPASGIKVNQVVNLSDDLALALKAERIRIVAPIPGKGTIGIEIPNKAPSRVSLRETLSAEGYRNSRGKLLISLGKDVSGECFYADLEKMPHLLIAGATGSGKSVCINTIIMSFLFRLTPPQLRLLLIDPKMLELTAYNGIPHLLMPVVTDPRQTSRALRWLVGEMERRYKLLAHMGVRNIENYNESVSDSEGEGKLPYIVSIIDELADLMLVLPMEIEEPVGRLAQMSRAVGIHLIVATQRPSVDVITGVIKANFPSRIAFQVASKTDSRTILDMNGGETLLGSGDMLFLPAGKAEPYRVHGSFVSEKETQKVVEFLKQQGGPADTKELTEAVAVDDGESLGDDELFQEALKLVVFHQQGSISLLQRRLKVGYSRAARLMDMLEEAGIVGPFEGSKAREVLVSEDYLKEKNLT
ncbi:MAG: DNA translocase FtsK 4TM domain-containing protein [Candidatus Eisenbacteria bacterium]|nr:DNA translocase FtsK 4TM domain-containing protein [Candidatus Eisenbacteria bacterium]